jgi:hypothetical protein
MRREGGAELLSKAGTKAGRLAGRLGVVLTFALSGAKSLTPDIPVFIMHSQHTGGELIGTDTKCFTTMLMLLTTSWNQS